MIRRLRHFLIGVYSLFLIGLVALPEGAQAQQATQAEIQQMLEERNQQIKSILSGSTDYTPEQRQRLKELINGVLDFQIMAQTALGPHWDTLSTDRRAEFVDVFRDVVRAQSMSDLDVYNSKVTYDQISVQGDSAYVRTITEYKDSKTPVEYILERKDGEWKAEDIVVDEVSTAEGYARSFQSVMRKRGFKALMGALEKKRKEVSGDTAEG
ncbi:ABC transporter substrate-binding protein [Salinibacter sp. 10B]|uniref:MlaC/ttg2D family ABC transporter substrate-binding protein n=1 Tax=Salinibacter sp. 10B TaxID=1923971 RepID=UPI000D2ECE77|nr:ABC transporter substrate-binding protein [Salinibacter sp. 10B]PQJ35621.1 ABC transporter substrate-binding protein [Salinibacter sp. 10B]